MACITTLSSDSSTHRVLCNDHSVKVYDVWISELSHDDGLLQQSHSIDCPVISALSCEALDSNVCTTPPTPPHPLAYLPELTRAKMSHYPVYSYTM